VYFSIIRLAVHSSKLSTSGDHPLSMLSPESNIYYLLFSISLPSPNQCKVPTFQLWSGLSHQPLRFLPSFNVHPFTLNFLCSKKRSDRSLIYCSDRPSHPIMDLFTTQVLIHSHGKTSNCSLRMSLIRNTNSFPLPDFNRLMLVAESLITLLFPFSSF
jgi:hypothetical protein